MSKLQVKAMNERVPEGKIVKQKYYLDVLTKLRERVRKERPELWKKISWILHQDNAPAHNTLILKAFAQAISQQRVPQVVS
jgi:hypothetical protein